jgi:hypothetical protein
MDTIDHLCYTALFYHERVFYVKTQFLVITHMLFRT